MNGCNLLSNNKLITIPARRDSDRISIFRNFLKKCWPRTPIPPILKNEGGLCEIRKSLRKITSLVLYVLSTEVFTYLKRQTQLQQEQQAAISQKEIVFRFRKDVQSEKGWCLCLVRDKSQCEGDLC